jgi:hypothetical protein
MWLSECNMQDIQPAKEEQGSCGSLAGRGLDTPEYPHGCDTTSVLSTDDQGLDPAADD